MKKLSRFLVLMIVITSSCNSNNTLPKDEVRKEEDSSYQEESFVEKRIERNILIAKAMKGDTLAYNEVATSQIMENMGQEFLYYAITMADKYNYPKAYFDVYIILSRPNSGENFQQLGRRTQIMAKYYLLKSHELGCEKSQYYLDEVFKDGKIPKSSMYRSIE